MTGHKSQKVFDGYYSVLDKDIMSVNDELYSQSLKENYTSSKPKDKPSKNIDEPELEGKLKVLLVMFEKGLLPQKLYEKKVSELIDLK